MLDQAAQLFGLGWALWLEWFAFRLTLGLGVAAAAGLVALDVAIGVLLAAVVRRSRRGRAGIAAPFDERSKNYG